MCGACAGGNVEGERVRDERGGVGGGGKERGREGEGGWGEGKSREN